MGKRIKIEVTLSSALLYIVLLLPENASGEPPIYVNTSGPDDANADYQQTGNSGPNSDFGPYANTSVLPMESAFRQKCASQTETPELAPYENVRQPAEYEALGRRSPELIGMYDNINSY